MPKKSNTQITGKWIDSTTKECLETSLQKMGELLNKPKEDPDKFFPNGIELISLTLTVKEIFTFDFKIAGEKGLKNLLEKNQEVPAEKNDPSALEK
jgi:hypothetical protein